jgi:CBS-domain-containing membrane protein
MTDQEKSNKLKAMRASEVMIPLEEYPHMPYWFTIRQAIAELERSEITVNNRKSLPRAVLVFDERYQLLGMVRRRDILKGLEPEFLREKPLQHRKKLWDIEIDPNLSELSMDRVYDGIADRAEHLISDIMMPIESTVSHNDHIVKVIYEMNSHDLSLIPVLKEDRVVGVVRTVDVFHVIAKLIIE